MVILGNTKLKDALKEHKELKDFLINLSPKFNKLNNKFILSTVERWVRFNDIAKIGNISVCELLHKVNKFLGTEKELFKLAPECLKERETPKTENTPKPDWLTNAKQIISLDLRDRDDFFLDIVLKKISSLEENQVLQITNDFYPAPLIEMLKEEKRETYYNKKTNTEHHLYINYKSLEAKKIDNTNFIEMDVRGWKEDPFSEIIKKVNSLKDNEGLKLIQIFVPQPLINMIEPMGFKTKVEKINPFEHHIYFYRDEPKKTKKETSGNKVPVVIQSATPVVYPIIMRMLQSKRLMDKIEIQELKVWDKTEKHLGWIVNGTADISFSAIAAIIKLYQKGFDVKIKSIDIWDNFFLLTRNKNIKSFEDLKGTEISMPLIPSAPPFAITKFMLNKLGLKEEEDFKFKFGEPFGRPSDIKEQLLKGKIEAGVIREPEASFTIFESEGKVTDSIKYKDLWEDIFPGKGNLPNAGLMFKGEFLRKNPEIVEIFMEELAKATEWVLNNKKESANIAYDIMGITPEEAEFFLNRVGFNHKRVEDVMDDIKNYIKVLNEAGYTDKSFEDLEDLFI